jgi:cation transport regulator
VFQADKTLKRKEYQSMPREKSLKDLPKGVEETLPEHAKRIYKEAHHNALEQYKDPAKRRGQASLEEVAHKVAWAAVKKEYEKDETTGKWRKKRGPDS